MHFFLAELCASILALFFVYWLSALPIFKQSLCYSCPQLHYPSSLLVMCDIQKFQHFLSCTLHYYFSLKPSLWFCGRCCFILYQMCTQLCFSCSFRIYTWISMLWVWLEGHGFVLRIPFSICFAIWKLVLWQLWCYHKVISAQFSSFYIFKISIMKQFHFVTDKNVKLEGLVKLLENLVKYWSGLVFKYLMKDLGHRLDLGNDHVDESQ